MEGQMVSGTKMHEGYTWRLIRKNATKSIQVACGMSQKFKFEIHQNLVLTLA